MSNSECVCRTRGGMSTQELSDILQLTDSLEDLMVH